MSKMNTYKIARLEPTQNEHLQKKGEGVGAEPPPLRGEVPGEGSFAGKEVEMLPTGDKANPLRITSLQENTGEDACALLHSFALPKTLTSLFSCSAALFRKKHRGWGTPLQKAIKAVIDEAVVNGG